MVCSPLQEKRNYTNLARGKCASNGKCNCTVLKLTAHSGGKDDAKIEHKDTKL